MARRPDLPEPEPRSVAEITKPYTFLSQSAVRSIQRILNERNNPPTKIREHISSETAHPLRLLPIHLSREPITIEYPLSSLPDSPIKKRKNPQPASYRTPSSIRPDYIQPRKKHRFIDDSAVESDGEGGDVLSVTTTPANTPQC